MDQVTLPLSEVEHLIAEREAYAVKLPEDMPKAYTCLFCGKEMHLLKVNDRIAFYHHSGEDLVKCRYIGTITSFMKNLGRLMWNKSQRDLELAKAAEKNAKGSV